MSRTVTDAAIVLGAMTGVDPDDPATSAGLGRTHNDYTHSLHIDGLRGKRIGVPRDLDYGGISDEAMQIFGQSLEVLRRQDACLVDPADIPTIHQLNDYTAMKYEFKSCLNKYLSGLGPDAPIRSLKELIKFNLDYPAETLKYGQDLLLFAEDHTTGCLTEPEYIAARTRDLRLSREEGLDAVMAEHQLDAMVFPGFTCENIVAKAGYPSIQVPAGYTSNGTPFGITFVSGSYSEPLLITLAYAFEQANKIRKPPVLAEKD